MGRDATLWHSPWTSYYKLLYAYKSKGLCLNLFNSSCDSYRTLIDLDHSHPFLRCQISRYRDIVAAGCWTTQRPASVNGPTGHPPFVLNLDTQGVPTQGTSEHLNISIGFGWYWHSRHSGLDFGSWFCDAYLSFISLLLCRRVALRFFPAGSVRCNAGHSTSFLG